MVSTSRTMGFVFAVLFGVVLVGVLSAAKQLENRKLANVILGGYALRLVFQSFIREIPFFSHGLGGDSYGYEVYATVIADEWQHTGIHYVSTSELIDLGPTTLPANLFAFIVYLNGGEPTRLGCTALVALAAALSVLNVYTLALQFGAEKRSAFLLATVIYFEPAFFFYTCDSYKDALVVCLALAAVGSALRLSSKMSLLHLTIGVVSAWLLWYVRYYLIFVTLAPLVVGFAGFGSKSLARPLLAALALTAATLALGAFTDVLQNASERASFTFQVGTSRGWLGSNAEGGSGVAFDDDGVPYHALPAKLAYTLFSPFPWAGGSLGFHLGKIDAFIWYFILYRAALAVRQVDRRVVVMLLTFVAPCTIMYAMSMSNVGLIVRQRLIVVVVTGVLAALYKPKPRPVPRKNVLARRTRPAIPSRIAA